MKRSICFLLVLILIAATSAFAAGADGVEDFAMIKTDMPDIVAELKGTGYDIGDASDVTAYYGDEKLTVDYAREYDPAEDSTLAYLMVDASLTNERFLPLIKDCLEYYVGQLGELDAVRVVKFGEGVDYLISDSQSSDDVQNAIDSLKCDEKDTALYNALHSVYKDAVNSLDKYTRIYAVIFSDCDNDIVAGVTADEVKDEFSSHMIPLYACAPPNSDQSDVDSVGKIARASGGGIDIVSTVGGFETVVKDINDVTVIGMRAGSNNTSDKKTLSVKIKDSKTYTADVAAQYSKPDSVAPEVTGVEYDEQNNRFAISFSENVVGASDKGAYSVTDPSGKKWTVNSVEALERSSSVQLEIEQRLVSGEYTISFSGITDDSKEKNPVSGEAKITISTSYTPGAEDVAPKGGLLSDLPLWAIIAIAAGALVLIAAIVIILIVVIRKKNAGTDSQAQQAAPVTRYERPESVRERPAVEPIVPDSDLIDQPDPVVRHHVIVKDSVKVSLHVKTGSISEQNIEANVASSVIVGRSSACDIYIDDTKLSRQHFVIENIDRELYISDMDSMNGTFLNGSKISGKRKIADGDKILAGLSEITVRFSE